MSAATKPARVRLSEEPDAVTTRSPARITLAAAISERSEAKKQVAETTDGYERVLELVGAWEQKLLAANNTAGEARENNARQIAEAAKNNSPLPGNSAVRAAINAELEARDALDAARKAESISKLTLNAAEQTLAKAEARVEVAADGVLREVDTIAMLDEMESVQNRVMALRLAHRFYRRNNLYKDKEIEQRGERLLFWEFPPPYSGAEFQDFDRHPKSQDWEIARRALQHDPDAPLPGEPNHQPLPLMPDPDAFRAEADARGAAWALRMIKGRDAPATD